MSWCKEQGVDANFATKLALKAKAEQHWQEMTDVNAHEERFSGIKSDDIVSSHHLLDMLAKKDEKAYEVNEMKGKGYFEKGAPGGPPDGANGFGGKGGQGGWAGKGATPDAVGMDRRTVGHLLAGEETPGGMQQWMKGGKGQSYDAADAQANASLESFLDFMQHDSTPGNSSAYQMSGLGTPSSSGGPGGMGGGSQYGGIAPPQDGTDPFATPQQRMAQFDDWSRGDPKNRPPEEEEFISSRRGPRHDRGRDDRGGRDHQDRGRDDRSPRGAGRHDASPRGGRGGRRDDRRGDDRRGDDRREERDRSRERRGRDRRDSRGGGRDRRGGRDDDGGRGRRR